MKTTILIAILVTLYACNQKEKKETPPGTGLTETPSATAATSQKPIVTASAFDINKIPVSTKDIGVFPYLSAPDGYKYYDEKTKKFEEKYFFFNDSLVTKVGGQYFQTRISSSGSDSFEDTYIVNNYKQAIEKLGGIEIYSGRIPEKASELIRKENPSYVKDMYDPMPYQYKQFVIRTAGENVWIELNHNLNSAHVDLTILKEEILKESVGIVKASEIKSQIDKTGKAVLYINFDTDKSSLKEDGVTAVAEIAKLLEIDKTLNLSIEGHTDNTGDARRNKTLSAERANTVLGKLITLKIDHKRLKAIGYGADKPLVGNDTEENKAKNRRVELVKI